ncbi:MAG TPA: hypothetical protein VIL09_14975 [Microvirga sp.]|jgi:hypothetical protein
MLEKRWALLQAALQPGTREDLLHEIGLLKTGFVMGYVDDLSAAAEAIAYLEAIEELPTWAVALARRNFLKGCARINWNRAFCPNPTQVGDECKAILSQYRKELSDLSHILKAEVVEETSADARARVVQHWEKNVRPSMAGPDGIAPVLSPAAKLAELQARANDPPVVAEGLAKNLAEYKAK